MAKKKKQQNVNQQQNTNQQQETKDLEFLKLQYQVLSSQQLSHNQLVWTMPSLMMVAQTFLWQMALSEALEAWMRAMISLVSVLVGVAALQGFLRNRLIESGECLQMEAIEKQMRQGEKNAVMTIQGELEKRTILKDGNYKKLKEELQETKFYKKHPLSRRKSYPVWTCVMWGFLLVSVLIFFQNVWDWCAIREAAESLPPVGCDRPCFSGTGICARMNVK